MTSAITSAILRRYEPDECSADGVPLDWERCRRCGGSGARVVNYGHTVNPDGSLGGRGMRSVPCEACGGQGSLMNAVRTWLAARYPAAGDVLIVDGLAWRVAMTRRRPLTTPVGGLSVEGRYDRGWVTLTRDGEDDREVAVPDLPEQPLRCTSCGHPASDGVWDGGSPPDAVTLANLTDVALCELRDGDDRPLGGAGPYSPCDEGCRHAGPLRWGGGRPVPPGGHADAALIGAKYGSGAAVEALWRPVDVRVGMVGKRGLGDRFNATNVLHVRPWDLRPENCAVLCLRCWAARDAEAAAC